VADHSVAAKGARTGLSFRQRRPVMQVEAPGVARSAEQVRPVRRHGGCGWPEPSALERIGRDRRRRDSLVDDLVDEGGVGAVLQQPPHEIGQQVACAPTGA
jgi:hypothetical protein